MGARAEILMVDYEDSIPKSFDDLFSIGYRLKVVKDNVEASSLLKTVDVVIMLVSERRKEALKLLEHMERSTNPTMNTIVIIGGGEDKVYIERINKMAFQLFKKYRFGLTELTKAIENGIEMRELKVKERNFLLDLDRIEGELKMVENRLFTISALKSAIQKRSPRPN